MSHISRVARYHQSAVPGMAGQLPLSGLESTWSRRLLRFGIWRSQMPREVIRQSNAAPATSLLALAVGAAAFGAIAIGALAVGRIAIGRLAIKEARFGALHVDELTVRKLRVLERDGPIT